MPDTDTLPEGDDQEHLAVRLRHAEAMLALAQADLASLAALERHRTALLDSRLPASADDLPNRLRVEAADLASFGWGFHGLEFDKAGTPYRWTGPERRTQLVLWVDRRAPLQLRLRTANFGEATEVKVEVEGHVFRAERRGSHATLTFRPIPPRDTISPTLVSILPSQMHAPAAEGRSDPRRLGITLLWLEVAPA